VVVWVADTGVGMSPDELPRIFQEFHQAIGPDQRHHSGLGLAICKHLVELHGGNIWVESTLGRGTTFHFSLPTCENVVATQSGAWETWASVVAPDRAAVLVLGEDPKVVHLFQRFLDRYRVIGASDALAAGSLAKRWPIQAVIAVGPAGRAAMSRLHLDAESLCDLPMLSCSFPAIQRIGQEFGIVDYLTKPVTRERLQSAIQRVGHRVREALVVDDDPEMVDLLTRMLHASLQDCRVRGATGGEAGLTEMHRQRPDLVLLDLLMPGMDGHATLEAMRADEALRNVPVVVVSAWSIEDETVTAEALEVTRSGGLTIGELMGSVAATLDSLQGGQQAQ
jgi:CheY-like chemotaxis protein